MWLTRQYNEPVPWRFERKYHLNIAQYYALKGALMQYTKPDDFTRAAPQGRYLVRSLYFDNDNFQAYYEKYEGYFGRIKTRIRTYSTEQTKNSVIRAELKNRWGETIEKYNTFVSADEYLHFMQTGHWPHLENPVLQEFERIYYLRALKPKVLVEYRREGLNPRHYKDLRITFDHDVQSCLADRLFPATTLFKRHHHRLVVLEIKCRSKVPRWLSSLVYQHDLHLTTNSKFAQGLEKARLDLISPY